ncbi:MAG TPA: hypothetical protein DEP72_05435 [Clostridiales bacterium]|nr:MAG: hypothetical protein A2Y18_01875 [Clostridiales bacterium GWD2_32_19]HCC07584.1 hypothetical protein [Clostridiales bacterium]
MEKIVYIIVSSVAILAIMGVILNLFRTDHAVLYAVTTQTDDMKKVNADGMTNTNTYIGADVISFLRYNKDSDMTIDVDFLAGDIRTVDTIDRNEDINIIVKKIREGSKMVGINEVAYTDLNFSVEVATQNLYKFKIN